MINWVAVQAIAELVAAAGVIISLLYLAVQVRQTTASLRSVTGRAASDHLAATNMSLIGNWQLMQALVKAIDDPQGQLTDAEVLALDIYMNAFLRHHEDLFFQHTSKMIDDRLFDTHVAHLRLALSGRWVREHWKRTRDLYGADFRQWIDDLSADVPETFELPTKLEERRPPNHVRELDVDDSPHEALGSDSRMPSNKR